MSQFELLGTIIFGIAVLHTFSIKFFHHMARKLPKESVGENLFHLLGEIEIIFGLWAAVLIGLIAILDNGSSAIHFVESSNFTESLFVFSIMTVAATRPIVAFTESLISGVRNLILIPGEIPFYFAALVVGPLLGSFITEPAAMTVTALILRERYFRRNLSERFKYLTLGILFVNISIGGVLTPFAAPPVLMVAREWNWDLMYMLTHFGWKAAITTTINAFLGALICRRELQELKYKRGNTAKTHSPKWLQFIHLIFLCSMVITLHHPTVCIGILLFFIGFANITRKFQDELKLKQSLLVAFFLAGLVVLGQFQSWWLKMLLSRLNLFSLFLGTTALTAITDNAALTYLGSLVSDTSEGFKYALVAGAVTGGGLTVIANAPNPAGFSILKENFGPEGISPGKLFLGALLPTLIAAITFWVWS